MESCSVPPGFRFHPTDEELVGYYLRKKVASQKIDLDVIKDIDLYRIEPWDLTERCRIGYEEQNEWYFFSHKDKKYPTGTRTNRATMAGFWKATGRDKAVYDKSKLIGMRKTLVFYKGRAPHGQKSDWIMHEYRLESDENGPPQEEGWVVCRAFKKRSNSQTKTIEGWDSSYFYDEPNGGLTSPMTMDPLDYVRRQPQIMTINQNLMCKQETEGEILNTLNIQYSDQFIQLPQLESPNSLPLIKRLASSISQTSEFNNNEENYDKKNKKKKKVMTQDWRALDKFVASQLSQDQDKSYGESSSFGADLDMAALLLLQSDHKDEEANNDKFMSEFLNSSSSDVCDIGIFMFDK
ncbi:hypothetical protein ACFE04_023386 [Oxalis oulophora]